MEVLHIGFIIVITKGDDVNKEYMLFKLRQREVILRKRKAKAALCKDVQGNSISKSKANNTITKCNRDLRLIALIEYLLLQSQAVWIEDQDAIAGFEMLCEPSEHR